MYYSILYQTVLYYTIRTALYWMIFSYMVLPYTMSHQSVCKKLQYMWAYIIPPLFETRIQNVQCIVCNQKSILVIFYYTLLYTYVMLKYGIFCCNVILQRIILHYIVFKYSKVYYKSYRKHRKKSFATFCCIISHYVSYMIFVLEAAYLKSSKRRGCVHPSISRYSNLIFPVYGII